MFMKLSLLKLLLRLAALYYIVGAVVHWFGLTLFPWYDGALYQPYHDSVIALVALIFAILLFVVANDPVKNVDVLGVTIFCMALASVFSIAIVWKVDFAALGASNKELQTMVEGGMGIFTTGLLYWLMPKNH